MIDAGERVTAGRSRQAPELEPWVHDALLAAGVALVLTLAAAADVDGSGADGGTYLWAAGLGGLMLVRRRYPVLVVALSVAGLIAYYAVGYPPIGVAVPVAAAVFSAAEFGRLTAAVLGAVTVVAVSVAYRLAVGQDPALLLAYELPGHLLLLAAAVALGDSVRSRREARRQAAEVAALVAERYERRIAERLAAERLAIARDLHDSVGHAMTIVALHVQVAQEAVGRDDAAAADALRVISSTTATTLADVRRTVSVLRQPDRGPRAVPDLTDLESAVLPARQAGIEVETAVAVGEDVPSSIAAAAYRIVQESMTNVVRHSGAQHARVEVREADGVLHVTVADDGGSGGQQPRGGAAGHGIAGMRERAEALGGALTAARGADGFEVHASLPLGGVS
ncbi:sensor histidine kinase [Lysobacter korlensis]|uniref:histidine kinase n=1 Tax=Lysobacter korlensis TaxID=553636 RepID=A0ABV6RSX6_9GAMM